MRPALDLNRRGAKNHFERISENKSGFLANLQRIKNRNFALSAFLGGQFIFALLRKFYCDKKPTQLIASISLGPKMSENL